MNKLIVLLLLAAAPAFAQYPHHNHRFGGYGWVAPTVIGGVIGYEIARSQQPIIVQQPVFVQQPTMTGSNYVIIDGIIYHKQLINDNGVWREVLIRN